MENMKTGSTAVFERDIPLLELYEISLAIADRVLSLLEDDIPEEQKVSCSHPDNSPVHFYNL